MPGCNLGYSHPTRTFGVYPFSRITENISAGGASIRHLKGTHIQSVSQLYLWRAYAMRLLKSKFIRVTEKEHGKMLLHVQPTKKEYRH
ncbi:hypothetical protein [Peribacillus simplex]|uniref:hypothetical protein n=1 Tax=Peribacillus simplex TaxID=1478 RepID=UPI003D2BC88B